MNLKLVTLLLSATAMLAACGGDKQDSNLDTGSRTENSKSLASSNSFAVTLWLSK